jgi:hypothetical protein
MSFAIECAFGVSSPNGLSILSLRSRLRGNAFFCCWNVLCSIVPSAFHSTCPKSILTKLSHHIPQESPFHSIGWIQWFREPWSYSAYFAFVFYCPRLLYDSECPLFLMVWLPSIPPKGIQDKVGKPRFGLSLISQAGRFFCFDPDRFVSREPLSSTGNHWGSNSATTKLFKSFGSIGWWSLNPIQYSMMVFFFF